MENIKDFIPKYENVSSTKWYRTNYHLDDQGTKNIKKGVWYPAKSIEVHGDEIFIEPVQVVHMPILRNKAGGITYSRYFSGFLTEKFNFVIGEGLGEWFRQGGQMKPNATRIMKKVKDQLENYFQDFLKRFSTFHEIHFSACIDNSWRILTKDTTFHEEVHRREMLMPIDETEIVLLANLSQAGFAKIYHLVLETMFTNATDKITLFPANYSFSTKPLARKSNKVAQSPEGNEGEQSPEGNHVEQSPEGNEGEEEKKLRLSHLTSKTYCGIENHEYHLPKDENELHQVEQNRIERARASRTSRASRASRASPLELQVRPSSPSPRELQVRPSSPSPRASPANQTEQQVREIRLQLRDILEALKKLQ